MTDTRTTPGDGVHFARLVESPVETSAMDRRFDFVPAPKPRAIVMRPTTHTHFVVTSAIDMRDDVLRDEVPGIVGDACHGVLGAERDAIVQAIEQEDTRPMRRFAAGTTPPAMAHPENAATSNDEAMDDDVSDSIEGALRAAVARRDVAAIREAFDAVDDVFTMTLARGSSPSLDGAIAFARGSSSSLDAAAALARSTSDDANVVFVPMARGMSQDECVAAARMTMWRTNPSGGRSR